MSTAPDPQGITDPPIDELLDKTDSKYSLVIYAAKRARQINAYYSQLGEGLLEYVGPLVETHLQEKPLSIALRKSMQACSTQSQSKVQWRRSAESTHRPRSRRRNRRLQRHM